MSRDDRYFKKLNRTLREVNSHIELLNRRNIEEIERHYIEGLKDMLLVRYLGIKDKSYRFRYKDKMVLGYMRSLYFNDSVDIRGIFIYYMYIILDKCFKRSYIEGFEFDMIDMCWMKVYNVVNKHYRNKYYFDIRRRVYNFVEENGII